MSKQTIETLVQSPDSARLSSVAMQVGAWVLTAAALLAATEKLHYIEFASASHGQSTAAYAQPETIRAEGPRETARMFEEYDVGLRMPPISGS